MIGFRRRNAGMALRMVPALSTQESRNWAGLLPELIVSIAERLPVPDFVRFRAVCTTWASATKDFQPSAPQFPWLLVRPIFDSRDDGESAMSFFSLQEKRLYRIPRLPYTCSGIIGSSDGWLVIRHYQFDICLFNPITGRQIHLPSFSSIPIWMDRSSISIDKVVLSASPSATANFVAVALYGNYMDCLAFYKSGDTSWTTFYIYPEISHGPVINDIVYHDGKFFSLFFGGLLQAFNLSGSSPEVLVFEHSCLEYKEYKESVHFHLVSAPSGNLLHVRGELCSHLPVEECSQRGKWEHFSVFKFDPNAKTCWEEIKDLGGQLLFLDVPHGSMARSVKDVPVLKGNCIYFTSGRSRSIYDVEVFDLEKRTIDPFLPQDIWFDLPHPVARSWFVPSLS